MKAYFQTNTIDYSLSNKTLSKMTFELTSHHGNMVLIFVSFEDLQPKILNINMSNKYLLQKI